jgi:hypothetical protein
MTTKENGTGIGLAIARSSSSCTEAGFGWKIINIEGSVTIRFTLVVARRKGGHEQ